MIITMKTLHHYLLNFKLDEQSEESKKTEYREMKLNQNQIPVYVNEFWTSKQRQASSIHEVSYRACFKPQLPRFFIAMLTKPKDIVYDPFSGRGTTAIEAAILGRRVITNDINPLSEILLKPRLELPDIVDIMVRLNSIKFNQDSAADIDLSMFFHQKTEREIVCLKNYLLSVHNSSEEDDCDRWIRMVATNRLTGHSKGFFSVYTLPPNQATSQASQLKINDKRNQKPSYRDVKALILKKTKSLYRNLNEREKSLLRESCKTALFLQKDSRNTEEILDEFVNLTVTSPPFLNVVAYDKDNWLRCWFNSIDTGEMAKKITMLQNIEKWCQFMEDHFTELYRITKNGGWVCFEVGEVNKGKDKLDEYIVPIGIKAGFRCRGILLNSQDFTKTSNIWGISNNLGGTNTNRIVLFKKED
jgi:DNA modification methylase